MYCISPPTAVLCFHPFPPQEVIVSAGTIGSPQLLMLSGIGPKAELEALGSQSKVDLPVGRNLHDHVMSFVPWCTDTQGMAFR